MGRYAFLHAPFGWQNLLDTDNACHVIPLLDDRPHVVDSTHSCWCGAVVEDDGYLILHNSADGREAFETYQRLLS